MSRKKKKKTPRKKNPVAKALQSPALQQKVVKPKKGRGGYRRKTRTPEEHDDI